MLSGGAHDLQGTIRTTPESALETARFLEFTPEKFILEPDETQLIETQINFPSDFTEPAIYPVIFVQATQPSAEKAQITTALRLSVITLLRRQLPTDPQGEITGVDIFQSGTGQPIDFRFIIDNTGNVHMSALGTIDIFDANEREIAQLGMDSITLLPQNARWLRTTWQPSVLMPGTYTYKGRVEYDFGETSEIAGDFQVISPWQVQQRRGEITGLKLLTSTIEEGVSVTGVFHNRGNVPLDVQGDIWLSNGDSSKKESLDLGQIAPKASVPIESLISGEGLDEGDYSLNINLVAEDIFWQEELAFNLKERVDFLEGQLAGFFVKAADDGAVFNLSFMNTGTIPFELMGVIELYDENNALLDYLEVPTSTLVGGDLGDYSLDYGSSLSPGEYTAVATIIYESLVVREELEFSIK